MTGLSDVFKYISHFRHKGHIIGRKVGDMLEILTYAAISNDPDLYSRLHIEPKLHGFSDAGHKVEFVILDNKLISKNVNDIRKSKSIENPNNVIAFIECKRVGVEQTINSSFKKKYLNKIIPFNESFEIKFSPRDSNQKHIYCIHFSNENGKVKIHVNDTNYNLDKNERFIFTLFEDYTSSFINNSSSLRSTSKKLRNCRILEIVDIKNNGVLACLNDCLSAPQTPEKAKQASFVALDVRKKRFLQFDKRDNETEMISVLILTEFAHWETKSQNMIKACIDKIFIVDDSVIIEGFEEFEKEFGQDFYDFISKDEFEKNSTVRELCKRIVNRYNNKIFKDIEDSIYKKFSISNNKFIMTSS